MASSTVKRALLGLKLALAVQLCRSQDSGRLKWERVRFDTVQIGCRGTVSSSDPAGVFLAKNCFFVLLDKYSLSPFSSLVRGNGIIFLRLEG